MKRLSLAIRTLVTVLASLLFVTGAFGHDAFEITTEAWFRPAALELEVAMSRSTALAILREVSEAPLFDPDEFESLRPAIESRAATLFAISSDGVPLGSPQITAKLGIEQDVELRILYPRPAPGVLQIEAPFLEKLGYGFGNLVTIHGDKGAFLGQRLLTADAPVFQVTAAAAPRAEMAAPVQAASAAAASIAPKPVADANPPPSAEESPAASPSRSRGTTAAIVIAIILSLVIARRRRSAPR